MWNQTYTEYEVQYLTEIAFVIWELHCKDERTALENDRWLCMDYEDFTNFCITILRKSQWMASQERIKASLLDYIYEMIATKEKVLELYENFLNNYQQ